MPGKMREKRLDFHARACERGVGLTPRACASGATCFVLTVGVVGRDHHVVELVYPAQRARRLRSHVVLKTHVAMETKRDDRRIDGEIDLRDGRADGPNQLSD